MTQGPKFDRLEISVVESRPAQSSSQLPAGWMSADEIIDELMLQFDDEFWDLPLPPASVRH